MEELRGKTRLRERRRKRKGKEKEGKERQIEGETWKIRKRVNGTGEEDRRW